MINDSAKEITSLTVRFSETILNLIYVIFTLASNHSVAAVHLNLKRNKTNEKKTLRDDSKIMDCMAM